MSANLRLWEGGPLLKTAPSVRWWTPANSRTIRACPLEATGGKEDVFLEIGARRAQRGGRRLDYSEAQAIYRKHKMTLLADPW